MTLDRALRLLREQGRIRSPWLPGMLVETGRDEIGTRIAFRLAWWDDDYCHGSYDSSEKPSHCGWLRVRHASMADYRPSLTDPATVGCLSALLREATAQAGTRWSVWDFGDHWLCEPISGPHGIAYIGVTEGESIAAALIAETC